MYDDNRKVLVLVDPVLGPEAESPRVDELVRAKVYTNRRIGDLVRDPDSGETKIASEPEDLQDTELVARPYAGLSQVERGLLAHGDLASRAEVHELRPGEWFGMDGFGNEPVRLLDVELEREGMATSAVGLLATTSLGEEKYVRIDHHFEFTEVVRWQGHVPDDPFGGARDGLTPVGVDSASRSGLDRFAQREEPEILSVPDSLVDSAGNVLEHGQGVREEARLRPGEILTDGTLNELRQGMLMERQIEENTLVVAVKHNMNDGNVWMLTEPLEQPSTKERRWALASSETMPEEAARTRGLQTHETRLAPPASVGVEAPTMKPYLGDDSWYLSSGSVEPRTGSYGGGAVRKEQLQRTESIVVERPAPPAQDRGEKSLGTS